MMPYANTGQRLSGPWVGGFSWGLVRSLRRANANYHAMCPAHRTVFCHHNGCTWLHDGMARILWPENPIG